MVADRKLLHCALFFFLDVFFVVVIIFIFLFCIVLLVFALCPGEGGVLPEVGVSGTTRDHLQPGGWVGEERGGRREADSEREAGCEGGRGRGRGY